MKIVFRLAFVAAIVAAIATSAEARRKSVAHRKPTAEPQRNAEIEAATRLQVFLDRANFSPGVIDGHYGEFTLKALALYRQSRGEQPPPPPAKPDTAPNVNGLDLASVGPVFVPYTMTEADLQSVGSGGI